MGAADVVRAAAALTSLLAALLLSYQAWFGHLSMRIPIEVDRIDDEDPPHRQGFSRRDFFLWMWRVLLLGLIAGSVWLLIETL